MLILVPTAGLAPFDDFCRMRKTSFPSTRMIISPVVFFFCPLLILRNVFLASLFPTRSFSYGVVTAIANRRLLAPHSLRRRSFKNYSNAALKTSLIYHI